MEVIDSEKRESEQFSVTNLEDSSIVIEESTGEARVLNDQVYYLSTPVDDLSEARESLLSVASLKNPKIGPSTSSTSPSSVPSSVLLVPSSSDHIESCPSTIVMSEHGGQTSQTVSLSSNHIMNSAKSEVQQSMATSNMASYLNHHQQNTVEAAAMNSEMGSVVTSKQSIIAVHPQSIFTSTKAAMNPGPSGGGGSPVFIPRTYQNLTMENKVRDEVVCNNVSLGDVRADVDSDDDTLVSAGLTAVDPGASAGGGEVQIEAGEEVQMADIQIDPTKG